MTNASPTTKPPFRVLRFWAVISRDLANGCRGNELPRDFWPGTLRDELPKWSGNPQAYEAENFLN